MNDPIAPDRIGRFSRAELEAMRGKRGRKPPEYFEVFPDLKREPAPRIAVSAAESVPVSSVAVACAEPRLAYEADPLAARLAYASPEARRLVGDLLDLLSVPHRARTVAGAAQSIPFPVAAVAGGMEVPASASDAAAEEPPAAPILAPVHADEAPEPVYREPVYADPEADAVQGIEDEVGIAG